VGAWDEWKSAVLGNANQLLKDSEKYPFQLDSLVWSVQQTRYLHSYTTFSADIKG
jgi:hypothetical protein